MWDFVFEYEWLHCIYSMISTPFLFISVSGAPSPTFQSSWGPRQGDHISPFLFIIEIEGLIHAIKVEKLQNDLNGIQILCTNISMTHQKFLEDKLLYVAKKFQ